jgi:hypothetical protein
MIRKEQYETNIEFLKQQNDTFKSGVEFLEKEYHDKNNITYQLSQARIINSSPYYVFSQNRNFIV